MTQTRPAFIRSLTVNKSLDGKEFLKICFETCDGQAVAWPEVRVPLELSPGSGLYKVMVATGMNVIRAMEEKAINEEELKGKKCIVSYHNNGEYYECTQCRRLL